MDIATTQAVLDRVVFVLDRPRDPANVGAVVRLLGNFGLSRLRLVEPAAFDEERVLRYARRGEAVAARVERFPTLELALVDCILVLGTTRRERSLERPVLAPRQVPAALLSVLEPVGMACTSDAAPVAVLFGPEDFGLSNSALDRCNAIVTVPTAPGDASLNLAQAAVIVAYEIFAALGGEPAGSSLPLEPMEQAGHHIASAAELEAMYEAIHHVLSALYDPPIEGRTKVTMSRLRALFLRAMPRGDEVRLLTTIFEHAARELHRRKG